VIFYLEALDVLTADINDKVNIGAEVGGSLIVGNSLYQTVVNADARLDKVLAVACNSGGNNVYPVADKRIYLFQSLGNYRKRLTLV